MCDARSAQTFGDQVRGRSMRRLRGERVSGSAASISGQLTDAKRCDSANVERLPEWMASKAWTATVDEYDSNPNYESSPWYNDGQKDPTIRTTMPTCTIHCQPRDEVPRRCCLHSPPCEPGHKPPLFDTACSETKPKETGTSPPSRERFQARGRHAESVVADS